MKTQAISMLSTLILTVVLCATPAHAGDGKISATDLDLNNTADAAILYDRIRVAVRRMCDDVMSPWDGQKIKTRNRCVEAALEDVIAAYDNPQLTAVHRKTVERIASL